ncbi:MAG: adenylosuccinate lyase [Candidatus Saccharimonadales bacterium]
MTDAEAVKQIEKTTNHDVKAVEIWLRGELSGDEKFHNYLELVHFGCTSEDINNLAYAMMLRDSRDTVLRPGIDEITSDLHEKAYNYSNIPMLAHTHGQPATPTTLGKEMAVFAERLGKSSARLGAVAIMGKFSGATGSYNAVSVAYPEINWPKISKEFIESLGFEADVATTQIEPHDWQAVFASELALSNSIMIGLARDMWAYISKDYFKQQIITAEVGSSTMPHKVNPIDFENAEANFGVANALLGFLSTKLPISRLQRDLSDSSTQRAIGEAFGHTYVAQRSLLKGLGRVVANEEAMTADLDEAWPVLTEAMQTVMRR